LGTHREKGWLLVVGLLAGCDCSGGRLKGIEQLPEQPIVVPAEVDAGTLDAGVEDAGTDAGDAGDTDAGALDAGAFDAGTEDAGVTDAGQEDAGTPDAGCGDLRAWYRFDDLTGPVLDSSGCGNDGVAGAAVNRGETGKVGGAFRFGGTQGLGNVKVPNSTTLRTTTAVSITAWVKADVASNGHIASWVDGAGAWPFYFGLFINKLDLGLGVTPSCTGMGSFPDSSRTVSTGVWIHVAVTLDFSTHLLTYYFDGVRGSQYTVSSNFATTFCSASSPLILGAIDQQSDGQWVGLLDEIKLWSVALTPAAVCVDSGGTFSAGTCVH
jgi:hypothetical protein